ncbi:Pacrg, partial [Symbiodinium microadriaticum]
PLRNALSKFSVPVLLNVLKALKQLVQCADGVGIAMTPYYKQFLQPMNAFLDQAKNTGDQIDYGQRNNDDIGEEVRTTLETMERFGAPDAFKCIKFAIPP